MRSRLALIAFFFAAVLIADHLLALPNNELGRSIQNALHIPAFFALTILLHALYPRWAPAALFAAGLTIGASLEVAQVFSGRDASLIDLATDLAGITLAIAVVKLATRRRLQWLVIALTLAVTAAAPIRVQLAYHHRDSIFPDLIDPLSGMLEPLLERRTEMSFIQAPAEWSEAEGGDVISLCFNDNRYPGFTINELVSDWTAFSALNIQLYNPGYKELSLTLAVGHPGTPGTSAFVNARFGPGAHNWNIPTKELTTSKGKSDQKISHLILHSSPDYAGLCVLIASIRLESA